jgi:hypothetical protein
VDNAITAKSAGGSWVETFSGVLFNPAKTFEELTAADGLSGVGGAFVTVCLVFGVESLRQVSMKKMEYAFVSLPAGLLLGLALWLALATTLILLGACFNVDRQRLSKIYVTTGWSFAPWILMAPLGCYKPLLGNAFALVAYIPLIWVLIAQLFAIRETFALKTWQTLALVFIVPALYNVLSLLQFGQSLYVMFSALGR